MQKPPVSEKQQPISIPLIVSFGLQCFALTEVLYWIGCYMQLNNFTRTEYIYTFITLVFTLVGAFQLYFYVQQLTSHPSYHKRIVYCFVDDWIPLLPDFVWAYTLIDLGIMGLIIPCATSLSEVMRISFGLLVVVVANCICFVLYPTTIPVSFRSGVDGKNVPGFHYSKELLKKIHQVDGFTCACPSGHCSLAMFLSMCLFHVFGYWTLLNPLLIAISCVCTKQHVFIDTVVGLSLGYVIYYATQILFV